MIVSEKDCQDGELLKNYQEAYGINPKLLQGLLQRDALPEWAVRAIDHRNDWLASLHKNVTQSGWEIIGTTAAGLLGRDLNIAKVVTTETARAVMMPIATPSYLCSLLEIVNSLMVYPKSDDPNATMMLDGRKTPSATAKISRLSGMLEETGYLDYTGQLLWPGAVILGVRFLYYHELGHLSLRYVPNRSDTARPASPEGEFPEEVAADQFAFAMLTLELRRHVEWQPVGLVGIALALTFIALKEFSEWHEDGERRTRRAMIRMERLLDWSRSSVQLGGTRKEAVVAAEFFWDLFMKLLSMVETIPSPIFSLLVQTSDRPGEEWSTASNQLLRWCTFGHRKKVVSTIVAIRNVALDKVAMEPRARRVLDVIEFVRNDTRFLEPTLGLEAALEV